MAWNNSQYYYCPMDCMLVYPNVTSALCHQYPFTHLGGSFLSNETMWQQRAGRAPLSLRSKVQLMHKPLHKHATHKVKRRLKLQLCSAWSLFFVSSRYVYIFVKHLHIKVKENSNLIYFTSIHHTSCSNQEVRKDTKKLFRKGSFSFIFTF